MKSLRAMLPAILAAASCTVSVQAQNIFVRLTNNASATAPITINSPQGLGSGTWAYSAVAPVTGTTWNTLPSVAAAALTSGQTGNPNTGSAPGDYTLYASPVSLVDSSGAATTVTLNMVSHYAGTSLAGSTRESIQFVNQSATSIGADPLGLLGVAWRDQNNNATGPNTTWQFTFANLPVGVTYDLYFYGSGNTAAQGISVALAAGNGGATSATVGMVPPVSIFLPDHSAPSAVSNGWDMVEGTVDGSGNFSFIASRSAQGNFFLNGFQLVESVPEPAVCAMLGVGALMTLLRMRSRKY